MAKHTVSIEFLWNDLTEAKQHEIQEKLGMEPTDNGNWDVFPMAIMDVDVDD